MTVMIYYALAYFLIYSVLGWCVEVAYAAIHRGAIVNRGFLNGPVCPIYGFGMIAALYLLAPFSESTLALFFGGLLLTSTVELVGGYVLYHAYHMRWWDYSHLPFNIGGYVCLEFSIYWGIGVVLVMRFIHPIIGGFVWLMPSLIGWLLMAACFLVYAADLAVTLNTVAGLKRDLAHLEAITHDLKAASNHMTDVIGHKALKTGESIGEAHVQMALGHAELQERREALLARMRGAGSHAITRHFGSRRLLKAFPHLDSERYTELLQEIRQYLNE